MVMSDWRTYILIVMFMLATGSQTIQYFVPQLVGRLGYTGFTKQYMTIPIYAVAFVFILFFCYLSDRNEDRATWITVTAGFAAISFIIVVAVNNDKVKYAFLCFGVGGVYAACPLTLLVRLLFQPIREFATDICAVGIRSYSVPRREARRRNRAR